MNKKYRLYAALVCATFVILVLFISYVIDIIMESGTRLLVMMTLSCVGCVPLWIILTDIIAQYFESYDRMHRRRRLIKVPYTIPTKSVVPLIKAPVRREDIDVKVYKQNQIILEQDKTIISSDFEADTQIYSIKKK